jgi:hypothetical protein
LQVSPRYFVFVALSAWVVIFAAMLRSLLSRERKHVPPARAPPRVPETLRSS